ncbi:MAG: replication initiator protein A [Meiothermus sp.]|uniref:replication initiator protein A n=1 Tax=Meiothermus sp. TaxID=1955249 RepID=UPI0025E04EF1|nr:replication initiator protein A [Meiothermus sp.]MCS7194785.1 replication initiator protein A [Meiothermus sp.]MDW8092031.1 replication initiator protein A [Meiothermus sp.]
MPRKKPESTEVERFDEANVARLGLISIQERIPPDFTSWTVDFDLDGRRARLSCVAVAEHGGVPHGLDNDVSLALINLYQEAGCPEDGTIVTTAYRILSIVGWDTSGHYYQALKESLERLTTATYTASEAWRSGRKWTTVTFRYIERLEYTSEDDKLHLSGPSVLRIRLAREIVQSIRARYLKPLDLGFLTSLDRPLTRALYRLLDAQRVSPDGGEVTQFRTNIVEWAKACKIVDQTPTRVRRTLEGAHRELIERGYLAAVEYRGRGNRQEIIYTFAQPAHPTPEAAEVLERLWACGVARPVAQSLLALYGLERLRERLRRFEAILQSGYAPRNRAGFLVDVIRDEEDKYADPEGFVSEMRRRAEAARSRRNEALRREEERQQRHVEAGWDELDARGRAAKAVRMLALILGKHLPTRYYSGLAEAFEQGALPPRETVEAAVKAQVELRLQDFAQALIARLDQLG